MTARVVPDDAAGRRLAIGILRAGGLVAFPTDTVYGLAADLVAPGGLARLFATKERPANRAVVLLLADARQAGRLALLSPAVIALSRLWPGGLTLVCPQRPDRPLPEALTGGQPTIGLRVPDHPTPRILARRLGPLPTTSANRSGEVDARTPAAVMGQLGASIDLVLDGGPASGGVPSTVVDCSAERPRLLRAGAVDVRGLAALLTEAGIPHDLEPVPPGTTG